MNAAVALLLLGTAWAADAGPSTGQVRVATYNIQALHAGADDVIATLKALDADVIALQEVDRATRRSGGVDQPKLLADALGMQVSFGAAIQLEGGEYGIAVLSRGPIRDVRIHRLPRLGKEEPRIALAVTTEIRGTVLRVVNTHLAANWRAEQPDTIRHRQAAALVKALAKERRLIVLGDFNTAPGSEALAVLDRAWGRGDAVPTHPTDAPKVAIDHVFAQAPLRIVRTRAVQSTASDHLPLVADVALPEAR